MHSAVDVASKEERDRLINIQHICRNVCVFFCMFLVNTGWYIHIPDDHHDEDCISTRNRNSCCSDYRDCYFVDVVTTSHGGVSCKRQSWD